MSLSLIQPRPTPERATRTSLVLSVEHAGSAGHAEAVDLVGRCFRAAFGAQPPAPARRYAVARDGTGVIAALAIRHLEDDRSGLTEAYIGQPAEQWVSDHLGRVVERRRVVEAGGLAWRDTRCVEPVLRFAGIYSYLAGHAYVFLTATKGVRAMLRQFGIASRDVCAASPTLLPSGTAAGWGTYYAPEHRPRVCVIESEDLFLSSTAVFRATSAVVPHFVMEHPLAPSSGDR